jgi:quinol monooxygenase YgiN
LFLHIFARFEPKPGNEQQVLEELKRVIEPTRAEPGCMRVNLFESTQEPRVWFIHSSWMDERAFDRHVDLPHTKRLVERCDELLVQPIRAARTTQIA